MRAFLEVITKRAAHVNSNTLSTEVIRTPALRPLPKMLDKNPTANSLNPISFMVMGIMINFLAGAEMTLLVGGQGMIFCLEVKE